MLINAVAPFAGAWIEIENVIQNHFVHIVAPFAGAWIEIAWTYEDFGTLTVAPFAGAWIEIFACIAYTVSKASLPSRERGLKYESYDAEKNGGQGRSLRGSVD